MATNSNSKRSGAYSACDYGSEFEYDSEIEKKKVKRADLASKSQAVRESKPNKTAYVEERSRDEARYMRHHYVSTNAYARHKELVNNYLMYYGGKLSDFTDKEKHKTDRDIIHENHQFVWDEADDSESWDKQLAKKYYDRLFKEYCLADLSRYKENKVAMRWRTNNEVISGKGQFICGNKKCDNDEGMKSWEVNFSYVEKEVKKNCLVKLRLCPSCSEKLNHNHRKKEVSKELTRLREEVESVERDFVPTSSHKGKEKMKRPNIVEIIDNLLL